MYNRFFVDIDQVAANTTKVISFNTGLSGTALSAIKVVGVELEFLKPIVGGAAPELSVFTLATTDIAEELTDNDTLARIPVWGQNPGVITHSRFDERQTVQAQLWARLESYTATLQKVRAVVYYETMVLKELEYLRLVAAGA